MPDPHADAKRIAGQRNVELAAKGSLKRWFVNSMGGLSLKDIPAPARFDFGGGDA